MCLSRIYLNRRHTFYVHDNLSLSVNLFYHKVVKRKLQVNIVNEKISPDEWFWSN